MSWSATARVPVNDWRDWSKNTRYVIARDRTGQPYIRLADGARYAQRILAQAIVEAEPRVREWVVRNRLWVDLHVVKPSHKCDAHNASGIVADAIESATGLNDRWYDFRKISWDVDPRRPEIVVRFGQDAATELLVCAVCGCLAAPDAKGYPTGHESCRRAHAAVQRRLRKYRRAVNEDPADQPDASPFEG